MSWQLNPHNRFQIKTPTGFKTFRGIQKITKPDMVEVFFEESDTTLKCSPNHPLIAVGGEIIKAIDLIGGEPIEHESGHLVVKNIQWIPGNVELYDLLDVDDGNIFYTNGILSHNCEFIGSSNTLISPERLNSIAWRSPKVQCTMKYSQFSDGSDHKLDVYYEPLPGHQYIVCADVAGGKELDSSAIVVIDITKMPYVVVAKYRSDKISPMLYPDVIADVATKYNMAFVLVETNDNDVAKTLQLDLEYENLITTTTKAKGTQVGGGFTKNVEFGLRTNKSTKRIGCSNLKTLIESEKLLVEDYHIFVELNCFVSNARGLYGAEEGQHDDLVMCLVNFAWLVNQKYFKELTDSDVYSQLKKDYEAATEDDVLPFGFITSGTDDLVDDDGYRL